MSVILLNLITNEINLLVEEQKSICNDLTRHSDIKSTVNRYSSLNADLIVDLSNKLKYNESKLNELTFAKNKIEWENAILFSTGAINAINSGLDRIYKRLPNHIQEELKPAFDNISSTFNTQLGLEE